MCGIYKGPKRSYTGSSRIPARGVTYICFLSHRLVEGREASGVTGIVVMRGTSESWLLTGSNLSGDMLVCSALLSLSLKDMWLGRVTLSEIVGADVEKALFLLRLVSEIMLMASMCLLADLIRSIKRSTKCVTRSGQARMICVVSIPSKI